MHTSLRISDNPPKSEETFLVVIIRIFIHMPISHRTRCSNTFYMYNMIYDQFSKRLYSLNHSILISFACLHHVGFQANLPDLRKHFICFGNGVSVNPKQEGAKTPYI